MRNAKKCKEALVWLYGLFVLALILYTAFVIWRDPEINFWEDVGRDFFGGGRGGNPQESYLDEYY